MTWWQHEQLRYKSSSHDRVDDGPDVASVCDSSAKKMELCLGGVSIKNFVSENTPTPFYVYSGARISQKIAFLKEALDRVTKNYRIFFAMKANRNPYVLAHMQRLGVGIDTCSGQEVRLARMAGFLPQQISFTSVALTAEDLSILKSGHVAFVNLDSMHQIRLASKALSESSSNISATTTFGLRINPQTGFGYSAALEYSKASHTTKFGIYESEFKSALRCAKENSLQISGLHCHSGWGLQKRGMAQVEQVFKRLKMFIETALQEGVPLKYINIGGGLGTPLANGDVPLNLTEWTAILSEYFAPYMRLGISIFSEPGDFLVRDAGLLITKILGIEKKNGIQFVVSDASFAVNLQQASYQLPLDALCLQKTTEQENKDLEEYRIVGAINEAVDVFIDQIKLPPLEIGEHLAFPAVGAYGATMASNHCLRGGFTEYFLPEFHSR